MKLFDGLRLKKIDFSPVQKMAGEYFTHLCVASKDKSSNSQTSDMQKPGSHEPWWT